MREVSISQLAELASKAKDKLWRQAGSLDREPKIYLHWTAGHYGQRFDDYHINVGEYGEIYVDADLDETLSHTWCRNTGAVGIAIDGCYGATTVDLGDEAPTTDQIERMAQCIAILCEYIDIPCDKQHVLTHGEAADNEDGEEIHEPYGPHTDCERWDLEYLGTDESPEYNPDATDGSRGGDVLRGKAVWYIETGIKEV